MILVHNRHNLILLQLYRLKNIHPRWLCFHRHITQQQLLLLVHSHRQRCRFRKQRKYSLFSHIHLQHKSIKVLLSYNHQNIRPHWHCFHRHKFLDCPKQHSNQATTWHLHTKHLHCHQYKYCGHSYEDLSQERGIYHNLGLKDFEHKYQVSSTWRDIFQT